MAARDVEVQKPAKAKKNQFCNWFLLYGFRRLSPNLWQVLSSIKSVNYLRHGDTPIAGKSGGQSKIYNYRDNITAKMSMTAFKAATAIKCKKKTWIKV